MKLVPGQTLVIATHNPGKLAEIAEMLEPLGLRAKSAGALGLPEPEETETTFTGNAALKARAAARASGFFALADDSGICIAALGGEPGVHSARWAGEAKNFRAAMARVERELKEKRATDFSAKFVSVLALASPEGETDIFEGEVHGHVEFPPRGERGFGYDPIFVPDGMSRTFGEIDPAEKHAVSHRARAFAKFAAAMAAK